MGGPLSGYRIVDLSRAIAGPYGSMVLADLGAEVIKIEAPGGDLARTYAGPNHKGESFFYLAFNRNKKSLTLDVATASGREALYDLVKISDVVWDNFRPGVMKGLCADYETLQGINPKIVSCSISGYGATGPYRDWPSVDGVAQGLSGLLSITGYPGGPPARTGFPAADIIGGLFAALSVTSALADRERTGKGRFIDIGLLDSIMSVMAYEFAYYFCSGTVPGPQGTGHLSLVPYGAFKCKDGYVFIGPAWPRLAMVIGAEWMAADPRFKDRANRIEHRETINQIVAEKLAQATVDDWVELFRTEDIIAGPVNTIDKAASDPQVAARGMMLRLPHPLGGEVSLVGNPFKMEDIDTSTYTAPPLAGQDTEQVLKKLLGYSESKVERLKKEQEEHTDELVAHLQKTHADAAALLLERKQQARQAP